MCIIEWYFKCFSHCHRPFFFVCRSIQVSLRRQAQALAHGCACPISRQGYPCRNMERKQIPTEYNLKYRFKGGIPTTVIIHIEIHVQMCKHTPTHIRVALSQFKIGFPHTGIQSQNPGGAFGNTSCTRMFEGAGRWHIACGIVATFRQAF